MTKAMRYRSLHHHSTYSFLDGFALPESHVRRATELEMSGLALTDHGNISGHVQLEQAAKKAGIQPIFGCELYTGAVDEENRTQRKNHLTVIAESVEGYRNLMRIVTQSFKDFYYAPTSTGRNVVAHKEGLVIFSGCRGSLLATTAVGGKNIPEADASFDRARDVAKRFKRSFGDAFYLEVQAFPELADICRLNVFYEELSKELHIPLVATGDVHYTKPSESEMQMILHNVRGAGKQTLEEQARSWGYDVPLCPPVTDMVMYDRLVATGLSRRAAISAILNTEEISQRCSGVEIPKMTNIVFPIPTGYKNQADVWRRWLREGWEYRKIDQRPNPKAYMERAKYELGLIESKGFIDYFLVVSDLVKYAKDHGVAVGPGRGSAAASLICYLLRITEVDPMVFPNLVFERFIDATRTELPDIDLDFDDELRPLIKEYAAARYGADKVGQIGTFTTYKAKNTLDDLGRVYQIPKWEIDKIKGLMLDRSSGDLRFSETIEDTVLSNKEARATFEKYPDLWKSTQLEGNVRGMGIHAAGLVIANHPITEVCAIYSRVKDGKVVEVISADKKDAKYLGVLKLDLLGLSTMGMLRIALEELGMTLQDMYDLPLDDPATIDGFRRNDVTGIFQFEGRATKSVNEEVKPDNFLEICDVNALSRPGPLHSGASVAYVDAKFGQDPVSIHPALDNITLTTHKQIIYQEQILRIIREIGAFDWTEHEYIRKIIGQRMGKQEFSRQWSKFWAGARKVMDQETAKKIWGSCITAGAYAFNNAHTVSYSMIAYWQMWIKVNHPLVFYIAALMKFEKNRNALLRDAIRHEIEVTPPNPELSEISWSYERDVNMVVGGFEQIPTIGPAKAKAIVDTRFERDGFDSWDDLIHVKGIGPKTLVTIKEFVENDDPFRIFWMKRRIDKVKLEIENGNGDLYHLPNPTHDAISVPQSKGRDELVTWIGLIKHVNLRELFEINNKRGTPLQPDEVKDPHLNEWVILTGVDDSEMLSITIDRWKYRKFKKMVWGIKLNHDVVLIKGVKRGWQSWRAIYVQDMWVIDPEDDMDEFEPEDTEEETELEYW